MIKKILNGNFNVKSSENPLLWLAVGGPLGLAAFFAKDVLKDLWSDGRRSLGILGMQRSGKTRFLSFLKNIPYVDKPTGRGKYLEFVYQTKSGKDIKIREGFDIGGGQEFRADYAKIIENSSVVFYFFDIKLYLDDIAYMRECNSRFLYILDDIGISSEEDYKKSNKKLIFFATHKDQIGLQDDKLREMLRKKLDKKKYKFITDITYFINTTDKRELEELADKIFK